MLNIVNAKINLGLQIVARRPDGYHDLQTVFYPIGLKAGTPENPEQFCDILEIVNAGVSDSRIDFIQTGRSVDCSPDKNLVLRAARLFYDSYHPDTSVEIRLDKHIPDGAGIGGGSADASFTLRMLNDICGVHADDRELAELALRLGADCPFFILNRPAFAAGVGERLEPLTAENPLCGMWLLLVKPEVYISTREAFAGVTPRLPDFNLRNLFGTPVPLWRDFVHNDFEDSIIPSHPEFCQIKSELYASGAIYASLTGSGSCLYGIYNDPYFAQEAQNHIKKIPTIIASYLLKL